MYKPFSLDIKSLEKLLKKGHPKLKSIEGEDLVLFIGNTGAGKSTLINYLHGCEMKRCWEKTKAKHIVVAANPVAEIGNDFSSKTLYAEGYITEVMDEVLCDLAGIGENRKKKYKVCASISTEMAIQKARSIKAVVVVVDYNEFTVMRGKGFSELSKTLGKLIQDTSLCEKSIYFAITKINTEAGVGITDVEESIKEYLIPDLYEHFVSELESEIRGFRKIFKSLKSFVSESEDNREREERIEELKVKLRITELMKNNVNRIFAVDVLDKGDSKKRMATLIKGAPGISKNVFNFNRYDDERMQFNELIVGEAATAAKMIRAVLELPKKIKANRERRNAFSENIKFCKERLAEKGAEEMSVKERSEKWQKRLEKWKLKKIDKELEIYRVNSKIKSLKEQYAKLDSLDLKVWWTDSIDEERHGLGKIFWWTSKRFVYNGYSYDKAEVTFDQKNGKLNLIQDDKKSGEFNAHYTSFMGRDGKAEVKLYMEERKLPDNRRRLYDIDLELKNALKRKLDIENHLNEIEDTIKDLQAEINGEYIEKGEEELKHLRLKQQISSLTEKINELNDEEMKLSDQYEKLYEELLENLDFYQIMYDIANSIEFESVMVDEFVRLFEAYINRSEEKLNKEKKPSDVKRLCEVARNTGSPLHMEPENQLPCHSEGACEGENPLSRHSEGAKRL